MGYQFRESPLETMTGVLNDVDRGVVGAQDRLVELFLPDVRKLANGQLDTASFHAEARLPDVIHETFTRLFKDAPPSSRDRTRCYSAASQAMRHVLMERARAAEVRARHDQSFASTRVNALDTRERLGLLLAMDEAFERLRDIAPLQHEIVAARYFAGLSVAEARGRSGPER